VGLIENESVLISTKGWVIGLPLEISVAWIHGRIDGVSWR
jgi:hypothetical protein